VAPRESGYCGGVLQNVLGSVVLLGVMTAACGQSAADSGDAGSTGGSSSSSTGGDSSGTTGTGGVPTSGGETTAAVTTSEGTSTTSGATSGEATTGTTETGSGEGGETSTGGSTGEGFCDPDAVLDAVSFNYIKTVDVGVVGISAGYYNLKAGELVFLAASGSGVRMTLDGAVLGDVEAPAAVADDLDGAVYDPATDTALLVDRDCNLAEVDPVTLAEISVDVIDAVKFDVDLCTGVALGVDGNLYVASVGTDEVVVVSRDLMDEVDRFNVQDAGITSIDGIALIPGSENFLISSGTMPAAGIFTATGGIVAPPSDIGGGSAPLVGGVMPSSPDALFSVCANGQVWLCAGLQSSECFKYAPEGGGEDVCGCLMEL